DCPVSIRSLNSKPIHYATTARGGQAGLGGFLRGGGMGATNVDTLAGGEKLDGGGTPGSSRGTPHHGPVSPWHRPSPRGLVRGKQGAAGQVGQDRVEAGRRHEARSSRHQQRVRR